MIPGEKKALDDLAAASIAVSRALLDAKRASLRGEASKQAEMLTCALLADIIKFRTDFGFSDNRSDAA